MEFLQAIIHALIAMIIVGVFAFGGVVLGRVLKNFMDKRKEEKN